MERKTKANARTKVLQAIAAGKLVRQPCEVCGAQVVEAHHADYSKPLDVMWLCARHHAEWHATAGDIPKGGRPPVGRPTGRKVTLYMLPADEARAKQLGAGNLSLGVRIALQRAQKERT